jgi:hypothetical protein
MMRSSSPRYLRDRVRAAALTDEEPSTEMAVDRELRELVLDTIGVRSNSDVAPARVRVTRRIASGSSDGAPTAAATSLGYIGCWDRCRNRASGPLPGVGALRG